MNGLNQVRDAVVLALRAVGLAAEPAYGGEAKRHAGAVASVDVANVEGRPAGLRGYLGQSFDEKTGTVRELYGMQMNVTISVDVRAEKAAECETAMETVAGTLMEALPTGLRPGEISWNGIAWDKGTGMFLRRGSLACRAAFLAEDRSQDGTILDFILKGTMKN